MGLIDTINKDIAQITSNKSEFGGDIYFSPDGGIEWIQVAGIFTKHHTQINDHGQVVNSRTASVSVSESVFNTAGYQVRDEKNRVAMIDHFVRFVDSTGSESLYKIREQYPDETIGHIVFILDDAIIA